MSEFRGKYGRWAAAAARVWPGDRRAAVVAMSAATQAFARHRVSGGLFAL